MLCFRHICPAAPGDRCLVLCHSYFTSLIKWSLLGLSLSVSHCTNATLPAVCMSSTKECKTGFQVFQYCTPRSTRHAGKGTHWSGRCGPPTKALGQNINISSNFEFSGDGLLNGLFWTESNLLVSLLKNQIARRNPATCFCELPLSFVSKPRTSPNLFSGHTPSPSLWKQFTHLLLGVSSFHLQSLCSSEPSTLPLLQTKLMHCSTTALPL